MRKYEAVKWYVQDQIQKGTLKAGDKIPSEEDLVEILGVSRNPVRHGLSELVREGWIYKLRGSGSYVRKIMATDTIDVYALLYTENRRFETEIIHGMTLAVRNHPHRDLHLILKKPGNSTREMIEALHSVEHASRGGLIFLPVLDARRSLNRTLGATLRQLERPDFLVVQLDRYVPEYDGHLVMTDHRRAAYEMTDYLLKLGHRDVAVLYEHPENTSIALRFDGVRDRLRESGLELPKATQIYLPWGEVMRTGRAILERLIERGTTCIFCFENAIALEIYHLCRNSGIAIPEDISLCTFDDHAFPAAEREFITCSEQQLENLGFLAANLVLKNLETPATTTSRFLLESSLRIRRSVGEVKNEHQT